MGSIEADGTRVTIWARTRHVAGPFPNAPAPLADVGLLPSQPLSSRPPVDGYLLLPGREVRLPGMKGRPVSQSSYPNFSKISVPV